MNITDKFINNLFVLSQNEINKNVEGHIRNCFLDYVGCVFAGTKMLQPQIQKLLDSGICTSGNCSVFGKAEKFSMKDAAFINGVYSHVLEMDDGHRIATMHLAAPVFSALLAVTEYENLSYGDFIKGAVAGYETAIRLAIAMQPNHKKRGFHTTGTCGTLGVAMAVAAALNFDMEQMKSTLSAAVSSAAGVLEMLSDDSQLKPYNVGRAAMDGIQSAYVGKAGFEAPKDALMGRRGFYATMTDKVDTKVLEEFNYYNLYCVGTFFKPYAACRHCHPAIEAALLLREENEIDLSDIESVLVKAYDLAIVGHDHTEINGVNAAKMSIPYGVSIALAEGHAGINDFEEKYFSREDIKTLTSKVSVIEDPELSALIPNKRASIVEIKFADSTLIKRVDVAKGEPENPMTRDDIIGKFHESMECAGLSQPVQEQIISTVIDSDVDTPMTIICKSIFL